MGEVRFGGGPNWTDWQIRDDLAGLPGTLTTKQIPYANSGSYIVASENFGPVLTAGGNEYNYVGVNGDGAHYWQGPVLAPIGDTLEIGLPVEEWGFEIDIGAGCVAAGQVGPQIYGVDGIPNGETWDLQWAAVPGGTLKDGNDQILASGSGGVYEVTEDDANSGTLVLRAGTIPNDPQYSTRARVVVWDIGGVSSNTVINFENLPGSAQFAPPTGSAQILKRNPTIWVWTTVGIRGEDGFVFAPGTYALQVLSEGVWVDVAVWNADGTVNSLGVQPCLVQKFEGPVNFREVRLSIIQEPDPPTPPEPLSGEPLPPEGSGGGPPEGPDPVLPPEFPEPVEPPLPLPPDDVDCPCSPWYSNIAEMLQGIMMEIQNSNRTMELGIESHVEAMNNLISEVTALRGEMQEIAISLEDIGDRLQEGTELIADTIEEKEAIVDVQVNDDAVLTYPEDGDEGLPGFFPRVRNS